MTEEWREIPEFKERYEVSNMGRIRSKDRIVEGVDGRRRFHRSRMLKLVTSWTGHQHVNLTVEGKAYVRKVHRLVLEAFVGPMPPGLVCRHLNGCPTDNRLSNLAYGTHVENAQDAIRHGTNAHTRLTHCVRGHLLEAPNLVPSHKTRKCLACSRGRGNVGTGAAEADLQKAADRHYQKIMNLP